MVIIMALHLSSGGGQPNLRSAWLYKEMWGSWNAHSLKAVSSQAFKVCLLVPVSHKNVARVLETF